MQKLGQIENNFRIFVWVSWNDLNWGRLENNSNISAKQSSSSSYFSSLSAYSFHFFTFSLLVSFHHRRHICSIFSLSPHSFHFFHCPHEPSWSPLKSGLYVAELGMSYGPIAPQSSPAPSSKYPEIYAILCFLQFGLLRLKISWFSTEDLASVSLKNKILWPTTWKSGLFI